MMMVSIRAAAACGLKHRDEDHRWSKVRRVCLEIFVRNHSHTVQVYMSPSLSYALGEITER